MRLLILLLVSWNAYSLECDSDKIDYNRPAEEVAAHLRACSEQSTKEWLWSKAEARRVILKYPQLGELYEAYPYRFKGMLRILKEDGKRMEDVIRITPASRPAHVRELLGDRV